MMNQNEFAEYKKKKAYSHLKEHVREFEEY